MANIPPELQRSIIELTDDLFAKLKYRFTGQGTPGKRLMISHNPLLSLPGIFAEAAKEEGGIPNTKDLDQLLRIVNGYLEAQSQRAKSQVLNAVQAVITKSFLVGNGMKVESILKAELRKIYEETANKVEEILAAEATKARNISILDSILDIATVQGVEDPTVFFSGPLDKDTCDDCVRLHFFEGGPTPRLWYLSELNTNYGKHGDEFPSIGEQHPRGRGILTTLVPGYGFDDGGRIRFISPGFDALLDQRGLDKTESLEIKR